LACGEGVVANILARLTREITEHCRERLTGTKAAREVNSYRLFSAPFVATSKGLLYIKQSAKITV
jgi:hypothetical protein